MIKAAGGVLWRWAGDRADANGLSDATEGGGAGETNVPAIEIAVVHRPRYNDWSFPKGKAEAGEQPWLTAVREIAEETGHDAVLMAPLGAVKYATSDGKKRVDYWLARVGEDSQAAVRARPPQLRAHNAHEAKAEGDAQAGDAREIDEICWLTLDEARRRLTYKTDREVCERAAQLISKGACEARTIAFVRHSKAVARIDWDEGERSRPLTDKGCMQAKQVANALSAWGIEALASSPWARCIQTVQPYAQAAGLDVVECPELTEDAFDLAPDGVRAVTRAALGFAADTETSGDNSEWCGFGGAGAHGAIALCLHAPTLEVVLDELAAVAAKKVKPELPQGPWRKGEILLAHVARTKKGTLKVFATELWRP